MNDPLVPGLGEIQQQSFDDIAETKNSPALAAFETERTKLATEHGKLAQAAADFRGGGNVADLRNAWDAFEGQFGRYSTSVVALVNEVMEARDRGGRDASRLEAELKFNYAMNKLNPESERITEHLIRGLDESIRIDQLQQQTQLPPGHAPLAQTAGSSSMQHSAPIAGSSRQALTDPPSPAQASQAPVHRRKRARSTSSDSEFASMSASTSSALRPQKRARMTTLQQPPLPGVPLSMDPSVRFAATELRSQPLGYPLAVPASMPPPTYRTWGDPSMTGYAMPGAVASTSYNPSMESLGGVRSQPAGANPQQQFSMPPQPELLQRAPPMLPPAASSTYSSLANWDGMATQSLSATPQQGTSQPQESTRPEHQTVQPHASSLTQQYQRLRPLSEASEQTHHASGSAWGSMGSSSDPFATAAGSSYANQPQRQMTQYPQYLQYPLYPQQPMFQPQLPPSLPMYPGSQAQQSSWSQQHALQPHASSSTSHPVAMQPQPGAPVEQQGNVQRPQNRGNRPPTLHRKRTSPKGIGRS